MLAGSLSSADQKRSWRDLSLSPCAVKRAGIVDGILAENNYIRRSNAIVARSCEAGGAEQSGLLTRTATTESVSLCMPTTN
jgi:hypothetical protein